MNLLPPRVHITHVPGVQPERDDLIARAESLWGMPVCVHTDPERRGILWNHLTVLACMHKDFIADSSLRWALCAQNDVIPFPGFHTHIELALYFSPAPFLSLNHFSTYGLKLAERGIPYGVSVNAVWGQAVAYRRDHFLSYVQMVKRVAAGNYGWRGDDGLPGVYNLLYGTRSAFTSRALVEHQDWDSLVGHVPGRWRHAACTIETHPLGPGWGQVPRSGPGPSADEIQKRLAAALRKQES